ncbi:FAD-dependent oxidoreductase [Eubacteriales bacterium KG127]
MENFEIKDVKEYDVVVVGAGSPGMPAALAAAEEGLKVAILQKEPEASACGHVSAGIDYENSNKRDIQRMITTIMEENAFRSKRELLEEYALYSGKALKWLYKIMQDAGVQVKELGNGPQGEMINKGNFDVNFITLFVGPKPYDVGSAVKVLADYAEKKGVDIFYSSPAVKLIKEENRVKSVIAKSQEGYFQLNARKGIILATGDYQNDKEMMKKYQPDIAHFETKKKGRTGDGHKIIMEIGGRMENMGHTKMVHDMDAGPGSMMSLPFLRVKLDGKRFCNEEIHMEYMNCYTLKEKGHYAQIFDDAYLEKTKYWSAKLPGKDELRNYMPEEDGEKKGVLLDKIATFKADTLEELAEKLGITDTETFLKTVERYNELCKTGEDIDFGVKKENLTPIDTPPFYGTHRHVRFTQGCSGIEVGTHNQVLDKEDNPIEGLFAIGNLGGNFYGSPDYPLSIAGINLGHNYTQGYIVGKYLADKL